MRRIEARTQKSQELFNRENIDSKVQKTPRRMRKMVIALLLVIGVIFMGFLVVLGQSWGAIFIRHAQFPPTEFLWKVKTHALSCAWVFVL